VAHGWSLLCAFVAVAATILNPPPCLARGCVAKDAEADAKTTEAAATYISSALPCAVEEEEEVAQGRASENF